MTITTKFNVGQIVWIMFNDQPENWQVDEINVCPITGETHSGIRYKLHHHGADHCGSVHETTEWEHKIFATKRELCLSFLTDND